MERTHCGGCACWHFAITAIALFFLPGNLTGQAMGQRTGESLLFDEIPSVVGA